MKTIPTDEALKENASLLEDSDVITGNTLLSLPYEITAIAKKYGDIEWAYGVIVRVRDGDKYPHAGTLEFSNERKQIKHSETALKRANKLLAKVDERIKMFGYTNGEFNLQSLFKLIDSIVSEVTDG